MNDSTEKDPRTFAIIGAAMEVHRELGSGFLEAVYQKAMEIELGLKVIPFRPQVELPIIYKGQTLDLTYRPDFICYGSVIVELKALPDLSGTEESQIINYLKASKLTVGLLLNFGKRSFQYQRFILT